MGFDPVQKPSRALRVGVVSSFMPPHLGGLEVVAKTIFDTYVAAGFEVRWIASRIPENTKPRENGYIRVSCWNRLEEWLGVPWPIWGLVGVGEVAQLVKWGDVLHVHDCLYASSALGMFLAQRARTPVLLSQHIGFVRYPSSFLNGLERLAYYTLGRAVLRGASHVVFCTPAAEEFVTELLGRPPAMASTIPYGIDTRRFRPITPAERAQVRRKLGLPESSRVVLFAGRLVEKKGVDLFLEVSRQTPSCYFFMVGGGPLRPHSADNLTWIPFVPPNQMERIYHAANVLLLPSHSEGFPMSVLEAMATGLPVITSKGQTFADLLEREGACLVAERTPVGFREALTKFLETPGLAATIAARSRELVVRDYSLEAMEKRYLALIRDLAASS